jgi:hypothetical protein
MNLDFRKLSRMDQISAVQNIIDKDPDAVSYLAFIINNSQFDVAGWFDFSQSNEGFDYWSDLIDKQIKK